MKDLLLFAISICVGLGLVTGYSAFVIRSKMNVQLPSIQTIFRRSNFSLEKPPSASLVGKIASMSGEVDWQSRTATESAKIGSPVFIQQGENLVTKEGGRASVLFEGVAQINISEKSEVGFAQTLPANLVLAQGFGTVEYKKLGSVPISIRAFHALIENVGDITLTINAEKPTFRLVVNEGAATVAFNDINNVSSILEVRKGQMLIFNDDTRLAVVK